MRETLFRGKSVKDGRWIYGYLIRDIVTGVYMIQDKEGRCYATVVPETVGEYVGLTDKNGKKIFEDDIFFYNGNSLRKVDFNNFIYWVVECCYNEESVEVVGNVFDNPLLKGKTE